MTLLRQIRAEIANGKTIAKYCQEAENYPTVLLLPPVQPSSANWPDKNGADENYGPATRPGYRTDSRELTWRPCAPVQYGSHHSLSTAKCQSGILIDVRWVLGNVRLLSTISVSRSGPNGQPVERSQLVAELSLEKQILTDVAEGNF